MLPLTLHEIRGFYYDICSSWISWIYRDKHDTFYLFCKMVIDKTIVMAISLSNRSCQYEFNASIDLWLKTTSHYDVIAPSTVSTTQNAKLLTSRNLCHSLMLCHVTRSQRMDECETLRRPTSISTSHLCCAEIDAFVRNELGATHLKHWGLNKMDMIMQMPFGNAFLWLKTFEFEI